LEFETYVFNFIFSLTY